MAVLSNNDLTFANGGGIHRYILPAGGSVTIPLYSSCMWIFMKMNNEPTIYCVEANGTVKLCAGQEDATYKPTFTFVTEGLQITNAVWWGVDVKVLS